MDAPDGRAAALAQALAGTSKPEQAEQVAKQSGEQAEQAEQAPIKLSNVSAPPRARSGVLLVTVTRERLFRSALQLPAGARVVGVLESGHFGALDLLLEIGAPASGTAGETAGRSDAR